MIVESIRCFSGGLSCTPHLVTFSAYSPIQSGRIWSKSITPVFSRCHSFILRSPHLGSRVASPAVQSARTWRRNLSWCGGNSGRRRHGGDLWGSRRRGLGSCRQGRRRGRGRLRGLANVVSGRGEELTDKEDKGEKEEESEDEEDVHL